MGSGDPSGKAQPAAGAGVMQRHGSDVLYFDGVFRGNVFPGIALYSGRKPCGSGSDAAALSSLSAAAF